MRVVSDASRFGLGRFGLIQFGPGWFRSTLMSRFDLILFNPYILNNMNSNATKCTFGHADVTGKNGIKRKKSCNKGF